MILKSTLLALLVALTAASAKGPHACTASIYWANDGHQSGTRTASGTPLDNRALTAAHPSLPMGARVRVINARTGQAATVTITDRMPAGGRCIDLTKAAAAAVGITLRQGLGRVYLERE